MKRVRIFYRRLGLINRITPEGKVLEEALEMAGMILKSPPLALQLTKQALHRAAASGMQATEFEGLAMQMCRGTSDHKESFRAFRESGNPLHRKLISRVANNLRPGPVAGCPD